MAARTMTVKELARTLHLSQSEVIRMAERDMLPGQKVRGQWQFRTGEVWNWLQENLQALEEHRGRDRHPAESDKTILSGVFKEIGVVLDAPAKTKSSVLRAVADLAANVDPYIDPAALLESLSEREDQGSTALEAGIAVPHPARPQYSEGPILVACRTAQGIYFGERGGGMSDLFFLVCCPEPAQHLLFLGRLCKVLLDAELLAALRDADDAGAFVELIESAERSLCAD